MLEFNGCQDFTSCISASWNKRSKFFFCQANVFFVVQTLRFSNPSFFVYVKEHDIFNRYCITELFFIVAVFISQCLQLRSMVWLDGTSRQVLVQLKLPLIGFFSFFFLKRSLPFPRTLSASVILLAGIGYILSQAQVKVSERSWEYCYYGIPLGVTTVALSAAAGLLLDAITKTQKDVPYFAQIAQLRISSLFVVTLGMLVHALIENTTYKILFYGWNNRVVFLVS